MESPKSSGILALEVIAFTCCLPTVFILTTATSSSSWIIADGFNEGLFVTCIGEDAPSPLPFDMDYIDVGCGKKRPRGTVYSTVASLVITGLLFDFIGTLLICLGLCFKGPNKNNNKYKCYFGSTCSLSASVIALTVAVILYPIQFSNDLAADAIMDVEDDDFDYEDANIEDYSWGWNLGYCYVATIVCIVLIFVSNLLLIINLKQQGKTSNKRQIEEKEEEEMTEA